MSELDDLPSWAGRSTEEVQLPAAPDSPAPAAEEAVAEAAQTADAPEIGQPEIAAPTAAAMAPPSQPAQPSQPAAASSPLAETATQPAAAVIQQAEPRRPSRLRKVLFALLGLAVLAGAAGVGYLIASQDSDSTEASGGANDDGADPAAPAADADADAEGDASDGADGETDDAVATDETDAGDEDAADADADDGAETVTVEVDSEDGDDATLLNDGGRQAIFSGGKVYLSGAVPSEEVGEAIVAKAEAVVGPGNVVNEYTVDPTVVIQPGSSAPLFVEDVVLFDFNSIEIAQPFLPILDLGTLLLSQNPQASITVVTRTDAVGSEEVNLEVARRRAQAVINYWTEQGVNPDQIIADPRGEEGASEDDDAETAALQRRAEFIITGLLD